MLKLDPTVSTLSVASALAIGASVMLNSTASAVSPKAPDGAAGATEVQTAQRRVWAASSTGRVEPKGGEVRLSPEVPGRIVEVLAKTNETVSKGDLLVRLDDEDLMYKLVAARSEADVREREREEEPVTGLLLEIRQAQDKLSDSEREVFKARMAGDEVYRKVIAQQASDSDLIAAREVLRDAKRTASDDRVALNSLLAKEGVELPTRLESSLTIARTDVAQLEAAIEKTRIRAPADGTILNVWARVGEQANLSPQGSVVLFGDISSLNVRAEVEERDVVKVKVGQQVVVRADAFPGRDFEGVVTEMAPALGTPRIATRGPRRPNDIEVLEVLISLDGKPPLLTGMRVDVFFKNLSKASAVGPKGTEMTDAGSLGASQ
jgi:HlyD family secretion protein